MILPRRFYRRSCIEVARDILGKVLVHGRTSGIIVETEAYPGVYMGEPDFASHSAAGITDRTRVIFGPPGHAYVYLSYGMHECLNIVAEPPGTPGCILIRALQPLAGIEIMKTRRPRAKTERDLASGPGKLTQALAITLADNGTDVTTGSLTVRTPKVEVPHEVEITARIGITKCPDLPLRFHIRGNAFVSR